MVKCRCTILGTINISAVDTPFSFEMHTLFEIARHGFIIATATQYFTWRADICMWNAAGSPPSTLCMQEEVSAILQLLTNVEIHKLEKSPDM